jgi:hypothetical protein
MAVEFLPTKQNKAETPEPFNTSNGVGNSFLKLIPVVAIIGDKGLEDCPVSFSRDDAQSIAKAMRNSNIGVFHHNRVEYATFLEACNGFTLLHR